MGSYNPRDNRMTSLKLMGKRLGLTYIPDFLQTDKVAWENEIKDANQLKEKNKIDPNIIGVDHQRYRLEKNGGILQQERMIFDKRRSFDRAVLYSYQGALIKNVKAEENTLPCRALINPDKNKYDYDDKIVSVGYENNFNAGDVFEWIGTNTYWLITLQEIEELAYFRGSIRKCSYQIDWEDENGKHTTYAAIRGPVETKIDYIQKHSISIDEPNHSLHILMPRNKETLEYFRRYSKFYLKGEEEGSPKVCWRVEATDWISTPGILEITAVEYYINKTEDDVEAGLVGSLITKPINPNNSTTEFMIEGDTFIKPQRVYEYIFNGAGYTIEDGWKIDTKFPIQWEVDKNNKKRLRLKWKSNYSGQFILTYGKYEKTIVVESLF